VYAPLVFATVGAVTVKVTVPAELAQTDAFTGSLVMGLCPTSVDTHVSSSVKQNVNNRATEVESMAIGTVRRTSSEVGRMLAGPSGNAAPPRVIILAFYPTFYGCPYGFANGACATGNEHPDTHAMATWASKRVLRIGTGERILQPHIGTRHVQVGPRK
jgi:hypothetical protein